MTAALAKTKTPSQTAGGPQIIQYLCQYREEQPEGGGGDKRGQAASALIIAPYANRHLVCGLLPPLTALLNNLMNWP